jgi:phosphoribosylformimino-5-aminoimidazole carboxamide ribotide isomerase
MIEVVPAIDIIGGAVVRLSEGDFARRTDYATDPVELAKHYAAAGFRRLHLVDLDGARAGHIVHAGLLRRIVDASGLAVDFGGGVRSRADVAAALAAGAVQVNIGSAAISDPEMVVACLAEHGADAIILGADARDGLVAAHGWREQTALTLDALIERFTPFGLSWALVTDIGRDGMLSGPAVDLYARLTAAFPKVGFIGSGGVASMDDIRALDAIGVPRVVVGKALLEGRISAQEAVAYAR